MADAQMPHEGHKKHLCYLTNLDFQITNPKDYAELVSQPTHFCKVCGRAAADPKSLCKPVKI
jgi:hypothetical protein